MTVQLIKWSYLRKERAASNCAGDHITHTKRRNSHHTTCRQSKMLSLPVYLSNQSGQKRKKTWRTGGHIRLLLPAICIFCIDPIVHTYINTYIPTCLYSVMILSILQRGLSFCTSQVDWLSSRWSGRLVERRACTSEAHDGRAQQGKAQPASHPERVWL